jgi:hypothetical protein
METSMSTSGSKKQPKSSCCDACLKMTTTLSGLKALISADGYIHVIEQGPASGCHICAIIRGDPSFEDETVSRIKLNQTWQSRWLGSRDLWEHFKRFPISTMNIVVYSQPKESSVLKFRQKLEFNAHVMKRKSTVIFKGKTFVLIVLKLIHMHLASPVCYRLTTFRRNRYGPEWRVGCGSVKVSTRGTPIVQTRKCISFQKESLTLGTAKPTESGCMSANHCSMVDT